MRSGKMTDGFAFIAWPAAYGSSGIMSFLGGPDATVFQKNLGPDTSRIAPDVTLFNPDPGWAKVVVSTQ